MFKIISFIWQLPQNLIGLFLYLVFGTAKRYKYKGKYVAHAKTNKWGAISLGMFIIFFADYGDGEYYTNTINHEYGHTKQSKMLGPFYLLIVGLPSIIWASCFKGYRVSTGASYYWFYTEHWADKLGGVSRCKK